MEDRPLRICLFSQNNPAVFSGGRYHALLLAEALALRGHSVHYVTNALPVFFDEMKRYDGHERIKTTITRNFLTDLTNEKFDIVVVTPGRSDAPIYYNAARVTALMSGAQLVLINFESGNWFNEVAPQPRDLASWDHWKRVIEPGGTVLSSAHESERWAKEFYVENPSKTRFAVWSPPINSAAADESYDRFRVKEKRAVIISRLSDPHKGMSSILEIIPEEMKGWTLSVISGSGDLDEGFLNELRSMGAARGLTIEFVFQPNDHDKFVELNRARVLIFPSMFEGYGYPPIEALYCNTEVVAYDLPVVRETCGEIPYYAPLGDREALREQLAKVVSDPNCGERNLRTQVEELAQMDTAAARLEAVFKAEADPANKTTASGTSTAVVSSSTTVNMMPSVVVDVAQRARNFAARQKNRLLMLRTAEGRAKAISRVSAIVKPKSLDRRFGVGECSIDQLGVISIRGWRIGGDKPDHVEAKIGEALLVPGQTNLARPDVHKKYSEYREPNAGFEVSGRFVDEDLVNQPVEILFHARGEIVDRIETYLQPAKDNSVTWKQERKARAKKARGRITAIVADLDAVRIGGTHRTDFLSLVAALKSMELHTLLILRANPVEALPHEVDLQTRVDELVLADFTKPGVRSEDIIEGSLVSRAVEKALKTAQAQRPLNAVVAFGAELAPALDCAQAGAQRLAYAVNEPDDFSETLLEHAPYIISAHAEVLDQYETALSGKIGVHLPLAPSAHGHRTPAPPVATDIVVPDVVSADAEAAILQLARQLEERGATATLRVLGQTGEAMARSGISDLPENVDLLGVVSDPDGIYANAAIAVVPYVPDSADAEAVRMLHRTASEVAAHGRGLLTIAGDVDLSAHPAIETCDNAAALADRLAEMMGASAQRLPLEREAMKATASFNERDIATELAEAVFSSTWPMERLRGLERDPLADAAIEALVAARPALLRTEAPVLLVGADLSMASAAIETLTAQGVVLGGLCSYRPGFVGEELAGFKIAHPREYAGRTAILAMLLPDEVRASLLRLERNGLIAQPLAPSLLPSDQRAAAALLGRYRGLEGVVLTAGDGATAPRTKRDAAWVATDHFVLASKSKTAPGKLDCVIIADQSLDQDDVDRIAERAGNAQLLAAMPMAATLPDYDGRLVRYQPDSAAWLPADVDLSAITSTSGPDRVSLRDALFVASWMGSTRIEVRGREFKERAMSRCRSLLLDEGIDSHAYVPAKTAKKEPA